MNTKILLSVLSGVLGMIMMMIIMLIAPLVGLPKMIQPEIINALLGGSELVGWTVYIFMGAVFAVIYHYGFAHRLPIESNIVKGLIFGFAIFVIAQASVFILPALGVKIPDSGASMLSIIAGNLVGHLIYGVVVAVIEHDAETQEGEAELVD